MLIDEERRKYLRLNADTEATVTRLENGETLSVRLIDLSPSGCSFSTANPVTANERLEVSVRSPSDRLPPFVCSGQVVRAEPGEDGGVVVGVEFTAVSG